MADAEVKVAFAVKRKFPGLTAKRIRDIISGVKRDNNDTLKGLTMAAIMGMVKRNIHDHNKISEAKHKEERQNRNETCTICFRMFYDHGTRNRHMKLMHGKTVASRDNTGYNKKCSHCDRIFKYEFSLVYHTEKFHSKKTTKETVHNSADPSSSLFECKVCGSVFKHEPSLKRHMKTHQKKEDHVCERCPATFSRKDNLIKHEKRVHSLANINVGLIRGSGVTEFICQMCGRNFGSDNSNLEAHLLLKLCRQANKQENIELDDKLRFPCDQCDKSFAEKDYLARHIRWKHGHPMGLFECSQCDASFNLKSSLQRHIEKQHGEA